MSLLDILTPLYILISLGFFLKQFNFPNNDFWPGIERMSYYVLFPTLILVALMNATINYSLLGIILIVILIPTLISGIIQWLGFFSPNISKPTFSSMFQGSIRNNTPISLVIVAWIVPDTGLAIMAVIILIMIPMNNLLSILILLHYGDTSNQSKTSKWWKGILGNPLIIACFLGLALNLLKLRMPQPLIETAEFLGRSALPFTLLAVGAGLKLKSVFHQKSVIIFTSFTKLILTPSICFGLCVLLDVEADIAKSAIIFCAVPTAVSSFILAKQMGGDADGMARIITFQTISAALTLPFFLLLAQQY